MATLKCLACGQDNKVGDESCSSCSSSLNLKLCSVCEAINAHSAERCHGCNADFRVEAEVVTSQEAEVSPRGGEAQEAEFVHKSLPAAWRVAAQAARKRSKSLTLGVWLVPLAALGLGYYAYANLQRSDSVPAPQATHAPEPATAVSGKLAPPKTAATVTHTQTGAAASSIAVAAPAPKTTAPARQLNEPPAAISEHRRVQVTHTKAALTGAAVPAAAPASAAEGRSAPAETRSDEPAECVPAVVALGLCKSK